MCWICGRHMKLILSHYDVCMGIKLGSVTLAANIVEDVRKQRDKENI
jgi:hypothetical protein